MTINIDLNIIKDIEEYCKLNNKDFDYELNDIIRIGFSIKKYGNSPFQKMKEQNNIKNIDKESFEEKIEVVKLDNIDEVKDKIISNKTKKRERIIKAK